MRRTITAICAAAALGLGISVAAQSTSGADTAQRDTRQPITITGCLQKTQSGSYFLTHAQVHPSTMGNQSSRSENRSQSQSTMGSAYNAMTTWNLEGGENMDEHLGQKVQVTGTPKGTTSGDKLENQSSNQQEIKAHDFDVKSVTTIASSCQ